MVTRYDKYMLRSTRKLQNRIPEFFLLFVVIILLVLSLNMYFPLFMSLAVGVSNLSLFFFPFCTIGAVLLWYISKNTKIKIFAVLGLIVSVFGLIIPQVAFLSAARSQGFTLQFNPKTYSTFSGSPAIQPTSYVSYKTTGKRSLSIAYYKSASTKKAPVVVLLHGGAWRYGSHLETGHWPETLTKAGFSVMSVEYRLSTDSYQSWQDTPQDVLDAVSYIKTNADALSIDKNNINILGQSAGGHLALLEAYKSESVQSVVALYAPIDLILDYETSRDKTAELDFIGGPPTQYKERYDSLSPINYVDDGDPRTLLIQGRYDDLVHPSQVAKLSSKLNKFGIENEVVLLPFTGHSFENQRGGFANQIATKKVLEFLKK